tara:strand:+ start:225 stop:986 length:762 start_codon:yes stop_codon:yes gene_type:complete
MGMTENHKPPRYGFKLSAQYIIYPLIESEPGKMEIRCERIIDNSGDLLPNVSFEHMKSSMGCELAEIVVEHPSFWYLSPNTDQQEAEHTCNNVFWCDEEYLLKYSGPDKTIKEEVMDTNWVMMRLIGISNRLVQRLELPYRLADESNMVRGPAVIELCSEEETQAGFMVECQQLEHIIASAVLQQYITIQMWGLDPNTQALFDEVENGEEIEITTSFRNFTQQPTLENHSDLVKKINELSNTQGTGDIKEELG